MWQPNSKLVASRGSGAKQLHLRETSENALSTDADMKF